jgi:filamentous hemagglutinin family protein
MFGINHLGICSPKLGMLIVGVMAFSANPVIAQVTPDGTLPTNTQVTTQGNNININGGTSAGSNLFHSFNQFSVPAGMTAQFQNIGTRNIQNIIGRVTGNSISNIEGILKADGTANLFLINPNGIVFGSNASLQIGGSFIGSTASSINFADGTNFSAINPQSTPLLTVSVPNGLQFGANAASISNQSQATPQTVLAKPGGLQVNSGKTLALVGGDITLEGGNLTAPAGRIELGSVGSNSLVSLNSVNQGWTLGYNGVKDFQNIQIIQRTVNGSEIPSILDTSSLNGGGAISLQGKTILIGGAGLVRSQTLGNIDGANVTITAQKLIVQDGAQVSTANSSNGKGGNLIVKASDSVEVIGGYNLNRQISAQLTNALQSSALLSIASGNGNAGDINIQTGKLRVQDGGKISAETTLSLSRGRFTAGTGAGGNLIVTASDSIELIGVSSINKDISSGIYSLTRNAGDAGQVTINTGKLTVRDGAQVSVSSIFSTIATYPEGKKTSGQAGNLNVNARSIELNNKGKLLSISASGKGGNLTLQVQDLFLMRNNSEISTSAGTTQASGDGGNITIDAPRGFVVTAPSENNDIIANSFSGTGGKISINANSIFGFSQRSRADLVRLLGTEDPQKLDPRNLYTSDITAFSQQDPSLNGIVKINQPDIDPSKGLVQLTSTVIDDTGRIVAACDPNGKLAGASFVTTGRGGIVSPPTDVLTTDAVLANWISLEDEKATDIHHQATHPPKNKVALSPQEISVNPSPENLEAQGWVIDASGHVVLVAQPNTVTPHGGAIISTSCLAAH